MNVVLFLTHVLNGEVWERFEQIKVPTGFDKIILLDISQGEASNHPRTHTFRFSDFPKLGYRTLEPRLVPGSANLPVIEFLTSHPQYNHAWSIEYDAMFLGDWATFLTAHSTDSDLISAYVSQPESEPLWMWWKTISGPVALGEHELLRSFNPVYRLSYRAASMLKSEYKAGWVGHFEVTMATLLRRYGMRIEDFGGGGSFCRESNRGRWYHHRTYTHVPFARERLAGVKDQLVHPIKLTSLFSRLNGA